MPRSETVHTVARPTEHPVHPVDPLSKDGLILSRIAEHFKSDAENLFHDILNDNVLRTQAAEAKNFSFDLNRYWQYARDSANNRYRYGKATDKAWLQKTDTLLKEIDGKLATQLAAWEEVTSPFSDRYDAAKIYDTAHELRRTIEAGLEKIKPNGMPGTSPQAKAEAAYSYAVAGALAGLSEQIGTRLGVLAGGKPVELVTMSRQAKELVERAAKDKVGETIAAEATQVQDLYSDFINNDYSAENLANLWERRLDLDVELLRKDLSPEKRRQLQTERDNTAGALDTFRTAIDKADVPLAVRKQIDSLRTDVFSADRSLTSRRVTYKPEELISIKTKRDAAVTALIAKETEFFKTAAIAVAEEARNAQDRYDQFQQLLSDAKTAAGKDPAGYWCKIKSAFLDQVEAVSGKELKKTLDNDAFDSNLSQQLNDWNEESKKTRLDPIKLQELASSLEATIASYSERAGVALRKEADPALREVADGLQAGLSALRHALAKRLQYLVDNGAFK
ncbi:MAG: hypothetical protein JOZ62_13885 [Acidobacteriaceae bacterium]|nr:hypothetical protein [Acidobacteriaceae bacterium]